MYFANEKKLDKTKRFQYAGVNNFRDSTDVFTRFSYRKLLYHWKTQKEDMYKIGCTIL